MMVHSLGYLTDIDRQPDREERSREKQSSLWYGSWDKEASPTYVSIAHILDYSNTQYNNDLIEHIVHRYIYSRYSPVFGMLYQLYYFFPSSTLISSSSLYLSVATWVTPQGYNSSRVNSG